MDALHSPNQSHSGQVAPAPAEPTASNLHADLLPACFLLAIIAGFIAFVAFAEAILPALFAAVVGGLIGLFFASENHQG